MSAEIQVHIQESDYKVAIPVLFLCFNSDRKTDWALKHIQSSGVKVENKQTKTNKINTVK